MTRHALAFFAGLAAGKAGGVSMQVRCRVAAGCTEGCRQCMNCRRQSMPLFEVKKYEEMVQNATTHFYLYRVDCRFEL